MIHHLLAAFQSPVLGWLTIAFFLLASVETYAKRIVQYKGTGALLPDAPEAPAWVGLIETLLKIALIVLNWQFGLLVYALGFILAVLGALEQTGRLLMCPFVGTLLPNAWVHWSEDPNSIAGQRRALRTEKTHFMAIMLLTAGAYIGLGLLLNAMPKGAATAVALGLQIPRLMLYVYIFWLAGARAGECGYRLIWLAWILGIAGRINDFEVFVIPAVVLASLVVSAMGRALKPSAEADPSRTDDTR